MGVFFDEVAVMVRAKNLGRMAVEQRDELQRLSRVRKHLVRVTTRARIRLKIDDDWPGPQAAESMDLALGTVYRVKQRFAVYRVKQRFAEVGLAVVLKDSPQAMLLLSGIEAGCVITDQGYESNRMLAYVWPQGTIATISPKSNPRDPWEFDREPNR